MAYTVPNIAVISFPRTASKYLVNFQSKLYGFKPAEGVLHKPEFFGDSKNWENMEEIVYGRKHVLHGHWHSLNKLPHDIYFYIKQNYEIVTSHRETKLVKDSVRRILNNKSADHWYRFDTHWQELIDQTNDEIKEWNISRRYVFTKNKIEIVDECPDNFI